MTLDKASFIFSTQMTDEANFDKSEKYEKHFGGPETLGKRLLRTALTFATNITVLCTGYSTP